MLNYRQTRVELASYSRRTRVELASNSCRTRVELLSKSARVQLYFFLPQVHVIFTKFKELILGDGPGRFESEF